MLRPSVALSRYWYFAPTLLAGSGDSELVWEAFPQFVYECCGWDVRIGYRSVSYAWKRGDDEALDLDMRGPIVGIGFSF